MQDFYFSSFSHTVCYRCCLLSPHLALENHCLSVDNSCAVQRSSSALNRHESFYDCLKSRNSDIIDWLCGSLSSSSSSSWYHDTLKKVVSHYLSRIIIIQRQKTMMTTMINAFSVLLGLLLFALGWPSAAAQNVPSSNNNFHNDLETDEGSPYVVVRIFTNGFFSMTT